MNPTSPLEAEIDARLGAVGLQVPADLKEGLVAEIRDLLRLTALLRGPRAAAAEPFTVVRPVGDDA